jgi:collagen type VI alpha
MWMAHAFVCELRIWSPRFPFAVIKPPPSKKICTGGQAEVVFVLDSSTSVGNSNWQKQLAFVTQIVKDLDIGADRTRVSLITYNTKAKVEFGLSEYTSKRALVAAIKRVSFSEGITATGDALALARTGVLNHARSGVNKIVILITDGRTNVGKDPIKEATKLKKSGATVIAVGITKQINK